MSQRLASALRSLSDEGAALPEGSPEPSAYGRLAWRAGARRRRRGKVAAAVAGLVVVAAAVLSMGQLRPSAGPVVPGDAPLPAGQGVPRTIYPVRPWLPTLGTAPAPRVAYVVMMSGLDRPAAVSVDGSYRYLPAPPRRDYELSSFAVSPDGTRLALAWSVAPTGVSPDGPPATVAVVDVTRDESLGTWTGQGAAGAISSLAFGPTGETLAWIEERRSDITPNSWNGTVTTVVLDMADGARRDVPELTEGPLSWSPDGQQLMGAGLAVVDLDTGVLLPGAAEPRSDFVVARANAWSPDGSRAVGQLCQSRTGDLSEGSGEAAVCGLAQDPEGDLTLDVLAVGHPPAEVRSVAGLRSSAQVIGWRGGRVLVGTLARSETASLAAPLTVSSVDPATGQLGAVPVIESVGADKVTSVTAARDLLEQAPLVDLPPPVQRALSWSALSWWVGQHVRDLLVVLALILLGAGIGLLRRHRARRRLDGALAAP